MTDEEVIDLANDIATTLANNNVTEASEYVAMHKFYFDVMLTNLRECAARSRENEKKKESVKKDTCSKKKIPILKKKEEKKETSDS